MKYKLIILFTVIVLFQLLGNQFVYSKHQQRASNRGTRPRQNRNQTTKPPDLKNIFLSSDEEQSEGDKIRLSLYNQKSSKTLDDKSSCRGKVCYPETGDLLLGRKKFLFASSTCGVEMPERYCVIGETYLRKLSKRYENYNYNSNPAGAVTPKPKCGVCDSSYLTNGYYDQSHRIENIVNGGTTNYPSDRFKTWWQSENGREKVYIQFDLEAEFIFTHIIITFKTFRPAGMVFEKSIDYGRTWKPFAYFAHDCQETFPAITTKKPEKPGDVYCESRYSMPIPSQRGEVVYKVIDPIFATKIDPYGIETLNLLKLTNLRVNFTKLHTLGDNLLDVSAEIREKYYYAIYEMIVRGSCFCYGHASSCRPIEDVQYDEENTYSMVHGQCECQHNTDGFNCEKCLPLYNDRPWKPGFNGSSNECKKCECNGHAYSCHFDKSIFELTDGESGGFCDECTHNTTGRNCEKCKRYHYRGKDRPLSDSCLPCNCFPAGSYGEECDYSSYDLPIGQCYCKENVEGRTCDRCKNGFYNLTASDPKGCKECTCNNIGTIDNEGCDKVTGHCRCKANVGGRNCDKCKANHYGLDESSEGCKPCDCSPDGSISLQCDEVTGQCLCKPHMKGRACDQLIDGFYCPSFDYHTYEAESAEKLNEHSINIIRAPTDPYQKTWTGTGFVRVYDGAQLSFKFDNIKSSGKYDIIIRYESNAEVFWRQIIFKLRKLSPNLEPVNINCRHSGNYDKEFSLGIEKRYHVVIEEFCFEKDQQYEITLEFHHYGKSYPYYQYNIAKQENQKLLIDSIVLLPHLTEELSSLTIDDNFHKDKFTFCREEFFEVITNRHEYCLKIVCPITIDWIGILNCECNPTGSVNNTCESIGGQCLCKPNIFGRKCDKCIPSTWGFSPVGCQACNCNNGGSQDDACNQETGQCNCHENIQGKTCDGCNPGYWDFPRCKPCNCNGHATECDNKDGTCYSCRNHTIGDNCELCEDGYYGMPTANKQCKKCMCPGVAGREFGHTCSYDQATDDYNCDCDVGYSGPYCEQCDSFYYGSPLTPGGECKPCNCNGKVDVNDPDACDKFTGECRKCMSGTDGWNCEKCKPGHYGDPKHFCQACNCNKMGTVSNDPNNCDPVSGQCRCLPNVIGEKCDKCASDFWNFKSGEGCKYCDCDPDGVIDGRTQCQPETGQCYCIDDRGGRRCDECPYGYWGDPLKNACKACPCNSSGAIQDQCDKKTGSCTCVSGVSGYLCDKCARGTKGEVPYCAPCHECFNDWDKIFNELRDKIGMLEDQAIELSLNSDPTSTLQDFHTIYNSLEAKLNDIKKLLKHNMTSDKDVETIEEDIKNIIKLMTQFRERLNDKKQKAEAWKDLNKTLKDYNEQDNQMMKEMKDFIANLTTLLGVQHSINESRNTSEEAEKIINDAKRRINGELSDYMKLIKEKLMSESQYNDIGNEIDEMIEKYKAELQAASNLFHNLSTEVCGLLKANCEYYCSENEIIQMLQKSHSVLEDDYYETGDSVTCGKPMQGVYLEYVDLVYKANKSYEKVLDEIKKVLMKLTNAKTLINSANNEVMKFYKYANETLEEFFKQKAFVQNLTKQIDETKKKYKETLEAIERDLNELLDKKNIYSTDEFNKIIDKINMAAQKNKDKVDQITKEAKEIMEDAKRITERVKESEKDATRVYDKLKETSVIIDKSKIASDEIENELSNVKEKSSEIKSTITYVNKTFNDIQNRVINRLKETLPEYEKISNNYVSPIDNVDIVKLNTQTKNLKISLDRENERIKLLGNYTDILNEKIINTLAADNSNNLEQQREAIEILKQLKEDMARKKNEINSKLAAFKQMSNLNEQGKKKLSDMTAKVKYLKETVLQIRTDIRAYYDYTVKCQ